MHVILIVIHTVSLYVATYKLMTSRHVRDVANSVCLTYVFVCQCIQPIPWSSTCAMADIGALMLYTCCHSHYIQFVVLSAQLLVAYIVIV